MWIVEATFQPVTTLGEVGVWSSHSSREEPLTEVEAEPSYPPHNH